MSPRGLVSGALALVSLLLAPACICPPRAAELADTGFETPRRTFESFQAYFRADLEDWEYRCFSSRFRRDNGITAITWGEVRDQMLREQPWLKLIAKAEIADEWTVREGMHVIEARVAGRTVHVKLVREDSYEIYRGNQLLSDDWADFDDLVTVREGRVKIDLPPAEPGTDLESPTSVHVERTWRIDDLREAPETPDP